MGDKELQLMILKACIFPSMDSQEQKNWVIMTPKNIV